MLVCLYAPSYLFFSLPSMCLCLLLGDHEPHEQKNIKDKLQLARGYVTLCACPNMCLCDQKFVPAVKRT